MDILNALWSLLWPLVVPAVLWVGLMVWSVLYSTKETKELDEWMGDLDDEE